jgi:hypothetical protein
VKATAHRTDDQAADNAPKVEAKHEAKPEPKRERTSDCVVDGGTGFHVGRAVNGKVCSYHAMHYDADGNRR